MERDKEEALRLLKKLLQFNEHNCTPEEFALVGVRIKAILEKYQLSLMDAKVDSTSELVGEAVIDLKAKNVKGWQRYLGFRIATAFDCKAFNKQKGRTFFKGPEENFIVFVGLKSDVEVCQYFYEVCSSKLPPIARDLGKSKYYHGAGLTRYVNNFMWAAAKVIGDRLDSQYVSEQPEQRNALVVVKSKVIEEYLGGKDVTKNKARTPKLELNLDGFIDGSRIGSKFSLQRGIDSRVNVPSITHKGK